MQTRDAPIWGAPASPGPAVSSEVIETPRLSLRSVEAGLARALYADRKLAGELAGAILHQDFPDPTLKEMLPGHATGLESDPRLSGWGLWLLQYKVERMVVGGIGFKGPPNASGEVAIGYAIVRAHRRRGLAVEGARALINWAFRDSRVGRVLAECGADNVASVGVLERLGFARLRGADLDPEQSWLRWEVTRSDWWRRQVG